MDYGLLLKGLLLGVSIAAPVGPIGVLCIQRSLSYGRMSGFVTGLGAATADMLYGAVVGFGILAVANFLTEQDTLIHLGGGILLVYLALRTFFTKPIEILPERQSRGLVLDYFSTLLLTLTNPATIILFIALFSGLGLVGSPQTTGSALALVSGVFVGSLAWWLFLSTIVSMMRTTMTLSHRVLVQKISGIVLLLFALYSFWGLV